MSLAPRHPHRCTPDTTMLCTALPIASPPPSPAQLLATWRKLRVDAPHLGARDVAARIGVSEGALAACRCGDGVTRLRGPWDVLVHLLPALGPVTVRVCDPYLTRGKTGGLADIDCRWFEGKAGRAADGAQHRWRHGFAITEERYGLAFHSLQFFDADGAAAHKVYLTDDSDTLAWSKLVMCFSAPIQAQTLDGQ
jgi:putative hemin transport protein